MKRKYITLGALAGIGAMSIVVVLVLVFISDPSILLFKSNNGYTGLPPESHIASLLSGQFVILGYDNSDYDLNSYTDAVRGYKYKTFFLPADSNGYLTGSIAVRGGYVTVMILDDDAFRQWQKHDYALGSSYYYNDQVANEFISTTVPVGEKLYLVIYNSNPDER